jgi:iron complex transport system substrate-binding protein
MRPPGIHTTGAFVVVPSLLLASALSTWAAGSGNGSSSGDTAGAPLPAHPERIVSTNLPTDEILLALLPPERLLAVSHFAHDPTISNVTTEARRVPHRVRGEAEPILALSPDLVFAFPYGQREVQALLGQAGVPVAHVSGANDIAGVRANIQRIGDIVGERQRADALVARMDQSLADVRRRTQGANRPRVLIWYTGGTTSGPGTLVDEVLAVAGGRNVAAEAGLEGIATLPLETALALDPDVLFVLDFRADARTREVGGAPALVDHPVWRTLDAVREGRVHVLPPHHAYASSHHVSEAALDMARRLHPQRFGEAPR